MRPALCVLRGLGMLSRQDERSSLCLARTSRSDDLTFAKKCIFDFRKNNNPRSYRDVEEMKMAARTSRSIRATIQYIAPIMPLRIQRQLTQMIFANMTK
jgi:hypothetical protein